MSIATAVAGLEYVPARDYQLSVLALYLDSTALAIHTAYTALGHRRGGTTVTDRQLGGWLGTSGKTVQRARGKLLDCDLYDERREGLGARRRTKRPPEFVHVPGIAVRALLSGVLTPAEFRLYVHVIHRRAEHGPSAGCGLTRAELAAELAVRPDAVSRDAQALCAKGFLHRQGRTGTGWVLIPQYAAPVRRRVSVTARYELADRRRRWGIPRPGLSTTPPARQVVTTLPAVHPPRSQLSTPPPGPVGCSPRSRHLEPVPPLERWDLTRCGPAPWDVDGLTWTPGRPSPAGPGSPPVPRPSSVRFPWDPPVTGTG